MSSRNISIVFISAVISLLISCTAARKNNMSKKFAANPVVAHRGAFKTNGFPENSIASLKEAIRLKCTGSEFDVRMTADDSLIINHDPHFNKLEIEKTSYAELSQYKLSNGEKLPTLREYLLAGLADNELTRLVLEIKPSGLGKERGKLIAERSVALVKELKAAPMTVYISFDYDILKKVVEIDPAASTQYLNGEKSPEQLKADGIAGADYHFSVFKKNPGWIEEAKKYKLILNAWTVNDAETMDWLLKSGFDFITTNEPELLLEKTRK
jgi:glycerophosphoryl diester phosphodiesterase